MTWSKTEAVRRLSIALLLCFVAGANLHALDDPIPLLRPGFQSAAAIVQSGELEIGGEVIAPPGSVIVVVGLPGQEEEIELEILPGGDFLESFPITPGTSGEVEVRLILPGGVLADSTVLHFE